jgi:hypothetical protein
MVSAPAVLLANLAVFVREIDPAAAFEASKVAAVLTSPSGAPSTDAPASATDAALLEGEGDDNDDDDEKPCGPFEGFGVVDSFTTIFFKCYIEDKENESPQRQQIHIPKKGEKSVTC